MPYPHVKRSGLAFVLLGILTLGIYPVCVLSSVRKEVASLLDGKGIDKQMPFVWAYLLGFLTLGIAPLIWICRMANKIQMAALEKKISKPRLSGAYMFWLGYVGAVVLVGPFFAFHRFFKLLNLVEARANEDTKESLANSESKKEMVEEVRRAGLGEQALEGKQKLAPRETPYPHLPLEEKKEEEKLEKPWTQAEEKSPSGRKWIVRVGKKEAKVFASKEEALSYARSLLAERKALAEEKAKKE